jgi:hypothetical protein
MWRNNRLVFHESGSVTSSIAGGGTKPWADAISVRAALGA